MRTGEWRAEHASGELSGPGGTLRLEPKVMDLLFLLASRSGEVVSREVIMATLWPGVVVGDDSLARTVSKLRQALGDDARTPRYVETIAKRGYRWCAQVIVEPVVVEHAPTSDADTTLDVSTWIHRRPASQLWRWGLVAAVVVPGIVAWFALSSPGAAPAAKSPTSADTRDSSALLARADDAYFQFSRADNEAAIELYQRVLDVHPDDPGAMAGLANALVQSALRWPQASGSAQVEFHQLGDALANGHLNREPQRAQIERARLLAERAIAHAPTSTAAFKAYGLVASAQGRFDDALAAYKKAIELDPDAWGPMINLGDVSGIVGRDDQTQVWFERAYAAMERAYADNPAKVRPWQATLGVRIATRLHAKGHRAQAEAWYRRVLREAPLDAAATNGLATLLRETGNEIEAERLCSELRRRTKIDCKGADTASKDGNGN